VTKSLNSFGVTFSLIYHKPAIFLLTAAIYFVYIPVRLFVKAKIDPLFFYRCLITLQALSHQR